MAAAGSVTEKGQLRSTNDTLLITPPFVKALKNGLLRFPLLEGGATQVHE